MAGKTDFIVNGSFERQLGGDATAWIDASPQPDVAGDGHTYQFRATSPPLTPPDGWTVTRGFFGLEMVHPTFKGVDGINVTQKKTGKVIWVPITSPLAAAMRAWDRQPGPFLRRPDGRAWDRHSLSNAWTYERKHNPALAALGFPAVQGKDTNDMGLVVHGLRGTACVRLLRAGANTRQIADMIGMSEPMVATYTRLSAQQENASAAVYHLERTLREQKNDMSNKGGA